MIKHGELHLRLPDLCLHPFLNVLHPSATRGGRKAKTKWKQRAPPSDREILLFFNSAFLDNRPPQKNSIAVQLWFCLCRPFNFDLHLHAAPTCRPVHPVMNPDKEVFCSVPLKEHKHCSYGRPDGLVLSPLTSSVTWTRWCSCGEQMFGLCGAQMLHNPISTGSGLKSTLGGDGR